MQSIDRSQFEAQVATLCAGFNVPVGERMSAYWLGCEKMSLPEFIRCVEYALGENGPEKVPTTGELWGIKRRMRVAGGAVVPLVDDHGKALPTIQEQLCAYATLMLKGKRVAFGPATYVYREWRDEKSNRCAECIGIVFDLTDGSRVGFSVAMMMGDPEGRAQALKSFEPGPKFIPITNTSRAVA